MSETPKATEPQTPRDISAELDAIASALGYIADSVLRYRGEEEMIDVDALYFLIAGQRDAVDYLLTSWQKPADHTS